MHTAITSAAQEAKKRINSFGELDYRTRHDLETFASKSLSASDFLQYRLNLGFACAQRCVPIWDNKFKDSSAIDLAGELVREVDLRSEGSIRSALGEIQTRLEGLFVLGEEFFPAIYAGFCAWAVGRDAIGDIRSRSDLRSESEMNPDEWDASFFASLAVTNSAPWERSGDPESGYEFWEWYLDVAVPNSI